VTTLHFAKGEFELEVGGTLSWAALDDRYSLSFVFKVSS